MGLARADGGLRLERVIVVLSALAVVACAAQQAALIGRGGGPSVDGVPFATCIYDFHGQKAVRMLPASESCPLTVPGPGQ